MTTKETIQEFNGKIVGYIITEDNGNAIAQKFAGPIVGTYNKYTDLTSKFAGPVIGKGKGLLTSLLYQK
jgi:hypothetical protein